MTVDNLERVISKGAKDLKTTQRKVEKILKAMPDGMGKSQLGEQIARSFAAFQDCLAKGGRGWEKHKAKVYRLEKEIVPFLEENAMMRAELSCETLITSCALVHEYPILSALILRPRRLCIFHTPECVDIARRVEDEVNGALTPTRIERISVGESESRKLYEEIVRILYQPRTGMGRVVFDATPSCQPFTSILSAYPMAHGLPVTYLRSQRINIKGRCLEIPFSQRLQVLENPLEHFGDTGMAMLERQFNSHLYEAALKDCQELQKAVKDLGRAKFLELLEELFEVYRDWDLFRHSVCFSDPGLSKKISSSGSWKRAAEKDDFPEKPLSVRLRKIAEEFRRFNLERCLPEGWEVNLAFLEDMDEKWINRKNIADEYRLVDTFVNALRRGSAKQGKYDDAVGRLYRCLEMCATLRLKKYGLEEPDRPDYKKFAENNGLKKTDIRDAFRAKGKGLPTLLALDDQMTLLELLGDPVARIYKDMKDSKPIDNNVMYRRNYSILAHGTLPLTEEDWVFFRNKVRAVISETIGLERFDELLKSARHGEIKIS